MNEQKWRLIQIEGTHASKRPTLALEMLSMQRSMRTQQSISEIYGAVPSSFVDFNVQIDRNHSRFR
ncbi:unnamed protein product [Camellia sinensis]